MKKFWLVMVFSLSLVSPVLIGCGGQQSQDAARDAVERDDAEQNDAEEEAEERAEEAGEE